MVVERDAGESGYIHLVFAAVGHQGSELGVERMYAFDEQHLAFAQLQAFAVVFAFACGEVVFGNLHFFAGKQSHQVALHGSAVNGGNVIEIISAVGQLRGVLAVYKIVVG